MSEANEAHLDAASATGPVSATAEIDSGSTTVVASLSTLWSELPLRTLKTVLIIDAIVIGLYLAALAFATQNHNLFFLLDLESEGNPPSWWYGTQQLLVGIVFLLLATRIFDSVRDIKAFRSLFFAGGLGFTYISLDEVGEVHEIGSRILVNNHAVGVLVLQMQGLLNIHHRIRGAGVWIPVYAIIGTILLIWLVPRAIKAFRVWRGPATTFLIGFGIFAFTAAILQVAGYFTPEGTAIHDIYLITEQALKMAGISIALYGTTQVLASGLESVTQQVAAERQPDVSQD